VAASHEGDHAHADGHDDHAATTGPDETEGGRRPQIGVFFSIYYCMTGLHAVHVIAGMIALSWLYLRCLKAHWRPDYFGPVDYVGLYWHLVDLIWIYLFPLLYLID
jgi:cytochrome c oxidase subunit 3